MPVPVVVDGYNLLYARGQAPSPASREALARDLVRWATARGRRAILVFDGWAGGERTERQEARGPITVCFTRYGERADDWIVRWVSGHPEAVVVTSDRAVAQGARRRGAAVLGAGAFAERIDAALAGEAEDEGEAPAPGRHASRQAGWLRGL
jgi:predicted RNA-binding protein with PIN domain